MVRGRRENGKGVAGKRERIFVFGGPKPDSGDVTQNAGSAGLITCVDDNVIIVKNGTCEKGFFIRVTALATGKTTGFAECQFDTHNAL
jgi:hypothetical protein